MEPFNLVVTEHSSEHFEFKLERCEVYSIYIINFVQCQIQTLNQEFILYINTGSYISCGARYEFDVESFHSLSPLRHLIGAECLRLDATETGLLIAEFSNGDCLELPPDEKYENWEFCIKSTYSDWKVGSSPGGGIWVFSP